jgi:poly(3-hydroxybutyrate) depolymerase
MEAIAMQNPALDTSIPRWLGTLAVIAGGLLLGCQAEAVSSRRGLAGDAPAFAGGAGNAGLDATMEAGTGGGGTGGGGEVLMGEAGGAGVDGLAPGDEGDSAGAAGVGGASGEAADTTDTFTVNAVCNPIGAGMSTVVVNGVTRSFSVQLPANTSEMALLFVWHGWNQEATTFANEVVYDVPAGKWVPFDPNAFPMPLMIVTPVDTGLLPPVGLDWDIAAGGADLAFFEGMVQCVKDQFNIDESRIYSFGFSAGAVFTNLLSAKYPHLFAATISESGAWFNDMNQWSDVSIPAIQWKWPAFNPADGGNVLLTHGGPNDYATVISLESANTKALPYLHQNGRTVVDCVHDFGHTLAPDLTQSMLYDYMWSHQLGGPALTGLLPSFPTPAHPVGSTSCTFHPAQ